MAYNDTQPRAPDGKWSGGLMDSLEHQLMKKNPTGGRVAAHQLAVEIMTNQGTYDPKTGALTAKGQEREALGHKGRVVDRAARQLGRDPSEIGIQNKRPYVK
jgi:hypothetical protein